MKMSPDVMSSSPTIIRSNVDFPHPDGPTRIMNSPSAISSVTSLTALNPSPYSLLTFWILISAMNDAPSTLDGAGGQPGHDPTLEQQNDDHDRDRDDDRCRHDR